MTTVINSPRNDGDSAGMSVLFGGLIVIIGIILFFIYGLPAIRANKTETPITNITVQNPTPVVVPVPVPTPAPEPES